METEKPFTHFAIFCHILYQPLKALSVLVQISLLISIAMKPEQAQNHGAITCFGIIFLMPALLPLPLQNHYRSKMYGIIYPAYGKQSSYQENHASFYSFLKDFDSKGKVYYLDKPIGCKQKPFSESELIGQLLYSKQQDLSSQVLTEKVTLKKASLIQLLLLVKERERIKQKNLSEIERRLVDSHSSLYKAIISGAMQARGSLERVIADLEKQGRTEQISCWRDTLPLRQELLNALEEYKGSVRRANLFLEEY